MKGKIIVCGSQKGGVGKTVTTFNLAYALTSLGKKVLAVDFDSQGNLSTCMGIEDLRNEEKTIGHLMMAEIEDEPIEAVDDFIQNNAGIDFISANVYLSAVDTKLRLEMGAEKMLSNILEPLRNRYDYILIDTAPTLGSLTINALAAADSVIIPVNPQLLAMMGLQDFIKTVSKIRHRINPRFEIAGILLTMCDSRTNLCKVLVEEVNDTFKGQIKVFETCIPTTVKVGEAVYYNMAVEQYSPKSTAGIAYRNFAKELIGYEG
ncbi:ParA family protein [Frisingicoccus sp.]|uniref:ParA family protein n=1 Tax=Frisingicoccus sp. TaxID=1918627 RepID=UPI003AB7681E